MAATKEKATDPTKGKASHELTDQVIVEQDFDALGSSATVYYKPIAKDADVVLEIIGPQRIRTYRQTPDEHNGALTLAFQTEGEGDYTARVFEESKDKDGVESRESLGTLNFNV